MAAPGPDRSPQAPSDGGRGHSSVPTRLFAAQLLVIVKRHFARGGRELPVVRCGPTNVDSSTRSKFSLLGRLEASGQDDARER
jgi:hypothetical protein